MTVAEAQDGGGVGEGLAEDAAGGLLQQVGGKAPLPGAQGGGPALEGFHVPLGEDLGDLVGEADVSEEKDLQSPVGDGQTEHIRLGGHGVLELPDPEGQLQIPDEAGEGGGGMAHGEEFAVLGVVADMGAALYDKVEVLPKKALAHHHVSGQKPDGPAGLHGDAVGTDGLLTEGLLLWRDHDGGHSVSKKDM